MVVNHQDLERWQVVVYLVAITVAVSRTHILRALSSAQGSAEATLAYYQDVAGATIEAGAAARMAGEQTRSTTVRDIMTSGLVTVPPDQPVRDVTQTLAARQMHRVLVTEGRRLAGLVTTFDLVRVIADGRMVGSPSAS